MPRSSSFQPKMPTASSIFSAYASLSALAMLVRSIIRDYIPRSMQTYLLNLFYGLFIKPRSKKLTLVIEEANANGIGRNEVYDSAELYLSNKMITPSTDRLKISKSPKEKTLSICFEKGEQINDTFGDVQLQWRFRSQESAKRRTFPEDGPIVSTSTQQMKLFELTLEKEHKENVINNYIPYILSKSKILKNENKSLKLCTVGSRFGHGGYWDTTNLDHPSTFDTLAMDHDTKSAIKADLDRFVNRKDYYKRVGRAWKRGYLLYGPPGTGKSSLIAAMANYLRFDVYDLQLGNLMRDSDLRTVLLATANRSILVIEDIDCSAAIKNRNIKVGPSDNGQNHKPLEVVKLLLFPSCCFLPILIFLFIFNTPI